MRTANLAIVFTGIVSYTEKLAGQTYEQSQRMLRLHEQLLLPVFAAFEGRVVKSMGGTYLVVFESPTQAVLCGAALQDRLHSFNRTAPPGLSFQLRVGANVGEVRVERGDVFGDPVNIAARIEARSGPDEVLFSEAVFLSMNRAECEAEDTGFHELKGVPEAIRIYKVQRSAAARAAAEARAMTGPAAGDAALPESPALAPLPYGGRALARAGDLPDPNPDAAGLSTALRERAREWADATWHRAVEVLPWAGNKWKVLGVLAALASAALAAVLLLPNAVENALEHRDLEAARGRIHALPVGPERSFYEGRLLEASKDYEGAARQYETASRAGERRAFRRLLRMAGGDPCAARVSAVRALGRLDDGEALPVLRTVEQGDRLDERRESILADVLGCSSRRAAHSAIEQLQAGGE